MGKRGPVKRKGAPTGVRLEPDLRAQLEKSAEIGGRSLSEEISVRLKASFGSVQTEDAVTQGLAAQVAHALDIIHDREGHAWHDTQRSWLFGCHAILEILSYFEPGGSPEVPHDHPLLLEISARGMPEFVTSDMQKELAKELMEPTSDDRQFGRSVVGERAARIAVAAYEARTDAADIVKRKLETAGWTGAALRDLERSPDTESKQAAQFIEHPPTDVAEERAKYEGVLAIAKTDLSNAWKGDSPKGDEQ